MTTPLYGPVIEDHAKNPRNWGALERPDVAHEAVNPLCGDKVRIELQLAGNRIEAVRFRAEACMISIASASVLTGLLAGMTAQDAHALPQEKLLDALETHLRPSRIGCALLPLEVLRGALGARH